MPRWMSEGRNRDDDENVENENVEIQPILTELTLHLNKNNDNKKPKELEGKRNDLHQMYNSKAK
jgi:hypothetical protein